nr:MAG TPA: hypothetical protein [Caudoviricetes sp.]
MKYKLLKDLPFAKAGEVFERVTYKSKDGLSDYDYLKISKREKDGEDETVFTINCNYFLDNLDEWIEKIKADGIHWKPKVGEKYFYINEYGDIECETWDDDDVDNRLMAMGLIRRTEKKCEEARDRRLAEVRLRRTSDFKPDWKNEKYGYSIFYGPRSKKLFVTIRTIDGGEIVRYATQEEAEKSIKEHEADWKKYFGIKEGK